MRISALAVPAAILLAVGCGRVASEGEAADGGAAADGHVASDGGGPPDAALPPDAYVRVADSIEDFALTQGAGGWHYLFLEPPSTDLAELVPLEDHWALDETRFWTSLWPSGGHPNVGGRPGEGNAILQVPVRRWISDTAGWATIDYVAARSHPGLCGDGVAVRLIVDGAVLWEQTIPGDADTAPIEGSVEAAVAAGSTVDLVLDPLVNDGCDSTLFTATISVTADR
jgi:hypothetical protein